MKIHFIGENGKGTKLILTIDKSGIIGLSHLLKPYKKQGFEFKRIGNIRFYFQSLFGAFIGK